MKTAAYGGVMEFAEMLEIMFIGGFMAIAAYIALVWIAAVYMDGIEWWKARSRRSGSSGAQARFAATVMAARSPDDGTASASTGVADGGARASRWGGYSNHGGSAEWHKTRDAALRRAGYRCQSARPVSEAPSSPRAGSKSRKALEHDLVDRAA